MVEIRPAKAGEETIWRALWQEVFGDGDDLLDCFSRCCPAEEVILLLEDGRLCSMLALPPVTVALPDGGVASGGYVYALATAPQGRGRGYARQLLDWVDRTLTGNGVDCVTVVPAQESLHHFFGNAGFAPCFATEIAMLEVETLCPCCPTDGVELLTAEEYNCLRDKLLAETCAVGYPHRLIAFQQGFCALSGGGLYRVRAEGAEGCAAVERSESGLIVKELLIGGTSVTAAATVLAQTLSAQRVELRTPAGGSALPHAVVRPFGMVKWLNPHCASAWGDNTLGYMGLGFD